MWDALGLSSAPRTHLDVRGCVGGRRLSSPPAVVFGLPGPSTIPVALGAATSGAQGTQ